MQKKQLSAFVMFGILLAACGGNTPTDPAATTGTIGGVRVIDPTVYQLGFTPLRQDQIVTDAKIDSVSVIELSAGKATAEVCGQIQVQDILTTSISLDSTGSMADTDPNRLRKIASQNFIQRMSNADKTAVLSFDSWTTPTSGMLASKLHQDFTSDKALLND